MDNLELREHNSQSYGPRTYFNAGYSDLTVAFAVNFNTAGEVLTEKAAKGRIIQFEVTKDFKPLEASRRLYKEMRVNGYKTLNIAGNGEYTFHGYEITQSDVNLWVYETLRPIQNHIGITQIRSGGQTGADMAGIVAGIVLKVPVIATFPKGFRQRLSDGSDVIQSQEEVEDTIIRYVSQLKEKIMSLKIESK